MELQYVLAAVRRHLALVAVLGILGALVGWSIGAPDSDAGYEGRVVLLVQPPASASGMSARSAEPDRYIEAELAVLRGHRLADAVAQSLPGTSVDDVTDAIRFERSPATDVITIKARASDRGRALQLVTLYVELYLANVASRAQASLTERTAAIDQRLEELRQILIDVQNRIAAAAAVPEPARRMDPNAEAERELTLREYSQLLDTRGELEVTSPSRVTTAVIDQAVEERPATAATARDVAIGAAVGLAAGLLVAVMLPRLSGRVVDEGELESLLGAPLEGELRLPSGVRNFGELLDLPPGAARTAEQLCMRAEGMARDDSHLVIAVVSLGPNPRATAVAVALAGRFAEGGHDVTLVDADSTSSWLSDDFRTAADGGVRALLRRDLGPTTPGRLFTPTRHPRVRVLGAGALAAGERGFPAVARRSELTRVIGRAAAESGVVVIDAGPLLDSPPAEQLVALSDCVVIALPARGVRREWLEEAGRRLDSSLRVSLPLLVRGSWRTRSRRRANDAQPKVRSVRGRSKATVRA